MPMKPKDMLSLYLKSGWTVLRQKGSHIVVGRGQARQVIPMHNRDLKTGLERRLLKDIKKGGLE